MSRAIFVRNLFSYSWIISPVCLLLFLYYVRSRVSSCFDFCDRAWHKRRFCTGNYLVESDVETYSSVSLNQGSEIQLCFLDVQILAFFFFTFFQRRQKRFQNFKYEDMQNSIVQYLNWFFPKRRNVLAFKALLCGSGPPLPSLLVTSVCLTCDRLKCCRWKLALTGFSVLTVGKNKQKPTK